MAVDYTNLFTNQGKILKYLNTYLALANTTLPADLSAIGTVLAADDYFDLISGFPESYDSFKDSSINWAGVLASKIRDSLMSRSRVINELPIGNNANVQDVIIELSKAMVEDGESIDGSVVTIGAVTADVEFYASAANVLTDKELDYVSPPGVIGDLYQYRSNPAVAGAASELANTAETFTLTCTQDSETGTADGSELFRVQGELKGNGPFDWRSNGAGTLDNVRMLNGSGMVPNNDFETFTVANTPDNFTINTGVAGTTIFQDSTAGNFQRGLSALQYKGNGATATIQITSTAALAGLVAGKRYCLAIWVKGDATIAAGALEISFVGTGYTASSTEKITMNTAALAAATGWVLKNFWITMPLDLPDDMKITIKVTGTLTNAANVRFDGLAFGPVTWHGGINLVIVKSVSKTLKNDRYSFDVSNDGAGVFQEFYRKYFKMQLPSDLAGAETQADSLAT